MAAFDTYLTYLTMPPTVPNSQPPTAHESMSSDRSDHHSEPRSSSESTRRDSRSFDFGILSSPLSMITGYPSSPSSDSTVGGIDQRMGQDSPKASGPANHREDSLSPAAAARAKFVPNEHNTISRGTPLLTSTPPTVARALSHAYPYIVALNKFYGLLTWTSEDPWSSFLLVLGWCALVLYWEAIVTYGGLLLVIGGVALYANLTMEVTEEQTRHPTLDSVVFALTTLTSRLTLFYSPITTLTVTSKDLSRTIMTCIFLTPLYLIVVMYFLSPRRVLLLAGVVVLTYHSLPSRVTRKMLWRSKTVRRLCFYLTGLDFSSKARATLGRYTNLYDRVGASSKFLNQTRAVRFTFVVYENQRRWIGLGWTISLFPYERAPWTDEFLSECKPIQNFELPEPDSGMKWGWVDDSWMIELPNTTGSGQTASKSKTSSKDSNSSKELHTIKNPGQDDGWIYYDNQWKDPTYQDGMTRFTRRRRWIRTAELYDVNQGRKSQHVDADSASSNSKDLASVPETPPLDVGRAKPASPLVVTGAEASGSESLEEEDEHDGGTESSRRLQEKLHAKKS